MLVELGYLRGAAPLRAQAGAADRGCDHAARDNHESDFPNHRGFPRIPCQDTMVRARRLATDIAGAPAAQHHSAMKVPPFKLDAWLAAHEFASPPIRYNLASSTGPIWTLAELMALGGASQSALADVRLSYAPPQGSKLLRQRIASLHGVDPDQVLVMTGASEALIALTCLFAAPGASIVVPRPAYPAVPVLARAWGVQVREYALRPDYGYAQTAESVLTAVDASTRVVFVNTPHNPTGSVMPANEQRKLAEVLAARGIPLIVDEVYHPLYHSAPISKCREAAQHHRAGRFCEGAVDPGSAHRLADRRRPRTTRSVTRSAQLFHDLRIAAHRGHWRTCPGACGRRFSAGSGPCPRRILGCSRNSCTSIARHWGGRRRPAGPRVSPGCGMVAMRGHCARHWPGPACSLLRVTASRCRPISGSVSVPW